jgi:glycosyltransferase involved in cell wall biosynthesis
MRICFAVNSLRAGGAERVSANLANEWVRTGHEVTLVTLESTDHDFYNLDPRIGRRALCAAGASTGPLGAVVSNVSRLRRLRRELAALRPDVIVSFMDTMNVLVLIASAGLRTPVVVSERIDPRKYPLGAAWETLRRLTYRYASLLVVQTESVADWARSLTSSRRVVVMPNPISDACLEAGRASTGSRARRVVGVGRLVPQKGFDTLIAAFDRAAAGRPEWSLVIAGQGPLEDALRAQALGTRAADRIALAGLLQKPEALLAASAIYVLSSRFEGFPNALVEGMACGCAVIATDCASGPAEIITSGADGLLVPVDDVDALAASLEALITNDDDRRRLGAAAARSVDSLRVDVIAERWIRLLRVVAPENRAAHRVAAAPQCSER